MLLLSSGLYVTLTILIAAVAALTTNQVFAWLVPLVLGVAQLGRQPSPTDPTFYVLLAGVHLLHVLSCLSRLLPLNGRIEIAALAAPFRRFALVQAISQVFAFAALQMLNGTSGTAAGLPIAAAAVLGLIGLILTRGMRTHASAGEAVTVPPL